MATVYLAAGPQARPQGRDQGPEARPGRGPGRRAVRRRDQDHGGALSIRTSCRCSTAGPQVRGAAGRFLYYVMPYIEGETIREKLNRETQFGIDEAVRITTEVADALDYAHRHGVIHRDIKPENILLHDGRAMVMDFGIALAVSAAAGGRMTETGLSLGTPHYMSPEQATADKAHHGAQRRLLAGQRALRDADRRAPAHGHFGAADHHEDRDRRAAASARAAEVGAAERGGGAREGAGEAPGRPVRERPGIPEALANPAFRYGAGVGGRNVVRSRPNLATTALAAATVLLTLALGWSLLGRDRPKPGSPMRFDITPDSGQRLVGRRETATRWPRTAPESSTWVRAGAARANSGCGPSIVWRPSRFRVPREGEPRPCQRTVDPSRSWWASRCL